jgi:hypothetical protein
MKPKFHFDIDELSPMDTTTMRSNPSPPTHAGLITFTFRHLQSALFLQASLLKLCYHLTFHPLLLHLLLFDSFWFSNRNDTVFADEYELQTMKFLIMNLLHPSVSSYLYGRATAWIMYSNVVISSATVDVSFFSLSCCLDHLNFLLHLLCTAVLHNNHSYITILITLPVIFAANILLRVNSLIRNFKLQNIHESLRASQP